MASLVSKKGIWYGVFTVNYRQKWIRIGRMSKTAAREALRKLEENRSKKKFKLVEEKQIPFKEYAKEYLEYSKTNKAQRTYERDQTSLNNLNRFFGSFYIPHIAPHQIERYKIERINEGVTPRTVNIELRCLSHMFNKAVEWEYITETPFKGIKLLNYEKKPPRFLTKEEVSKLLDAASPWLKPIIKVMLNTGIREGERARLKFEDIDFRKKRILIPSSKGKTYRTVPMNEEAENTLRWLRRNYIPPYSENQYIRADYQKEYVFCNRDGSPVKSIKTAFKNAVKRAKLKNVTPHTLRHTFASHLVMAGVDLRTVQKLLGHKSITTTMMYSHLTEDHVAQSMSKLRW